MTLALLTTACTVHVAVCPDGYFLDRDGDGFGDPLTATDACDPPNEWVPNAEDCDDDDANVHPYGLELCLDGIDGDCDGWDPWCAETVRGGAGLYAYASTGAEMGALLSASRDDGEPQFLVDVPGEGRVLVAPAGLTGTRFLDLESSAIDVGFAPVSALSFAGDLDHDGSQDVLIGVAEASEVWVVRGPFPVGSIWQASNHPRLYGPFESRVGSAVAGGGDVDDDGFADLVLGAEGWDGVGRVAVFTSRTDYDRPAEEADYSIQGVDPGDRLGASLMFPADLDGDGVSDLVAGAPGAGEDRGAVALLTAPLRPSLSIEDADRVIRGVKEDSLLGTSVDVADVDGDGAADLLVGAPGSAVAWIYRGPVLEAGEAMATLLGDPRLDGSFAHAVRAVPLDGGTAHVLVASPERSAAGVAGVGGVHLWRGPFVGLVEDRDTFFIAGSSEDDRSGTGLAITPDTNGDGFAEILIGSPGGELTFTNSGTIGMIEGRP